MTTEQRNKALFETFKGMSASADYVNGVICGYDPEDKGNDVLMMALTEPHYDAWHESHICKPVIETHKDNLYGYLWVSKDNVNTKE